MSKLVKDDHFSSMYHLWYASDEKIGTFQILYCDKHGNTLSFTDKSGADNCIKCIEELMEEL